MLPGSMASPAPTNLWHIGPGESCRVTGFEPSLGEDYRARLMDLGFHPGETVTCLLRTRFGAPRLFRVNLSVYSLDDQIARAVLVSRNGAP